MKTKNSDFIGLWHIYEMSNLDESYFNEDGQAYIKINKDKLGEFKFGYVNAEIDGKIKKTMCHHALKGVVCNRHLFFGCSVKFPDITKENGGGVLEFTFEGNDEMDPCQGRGWIKIKSDNCQMIEGELFFHMGDSSKFLARRAD